MARTLAQLRQELLLGFRENFGNQVKFGVQFEVTPSAVQSFEEKKRQQFAFLNEIDFFATESNTDQIIHMVDGTIVDKSIVTGSRQASGTGTLSDRKFLCRAIDQDAQATWKEQLAWGRQKQAFYNIWRAWVLRARARGLLRVGFNGQTYLGNANSSLTNYPMGEEIQEGWLEYMIKNYPQNVIGLVADANGTILDKDGNKYSVEQIRIGEGGDFVSMAELAQYGKSKIEIVYRGDTGIKVIAGDALNSTRKNELMRAAIDPMQQAAADSLLQMNSVSNMAVTTPDEFPVSGMCVTNPINFQYVYQVNGVYREVREWSDAKATQDLLHMQRDFVIPVPEAFVMVHPDAPMVKVNDEWSHPIGWTEWSLT